MRKRPATKPRRFERKITYMEVSEFFNHHNMTLADMQAKVATLIAEYGPDATIDYDLALGYYDSPECSVTVTESLDRATARV